MKPIEFSKEDRAAITAKLRDYFARELDQELGQLPAEMLLDFIGTEIGGAFYNRGVYDAGGGAGQGGRCGRGALCPGAHAALRPIIAEA